MLAMKYQDPAIFLHWKAEKRINIEMHMIPEDPGAHNKR
jgi:hypothetical protein